MEKSLSPLYKTELEDGIVDSNNKNEKSSEPSKNYRQQMLIKEKKIGASSSKTNNNVIKSSSDLRSTKTELFNKLISSQSQQTIVTTQTSGIKGNNKTKADFLYRANSLNTHSNKKQLSTNNGNTINKLPMNSTGNTTTNAPTAGTINNNLQQNQQLSLDDLKQGPIVFTRSRNRWYTNEEVASILTNFSLHPEWQTNELQVRPKSGAVLLYSREKVRYRQDGYCWKKRKNGRTTREDHMKLKVQGIECIYGCYVHSAILPTFHRRCYWLLQNPDIVLVHYLNQPPDDQNKMMITFNSSLLEADTRRTWTNEEIIEEIGSVFGGISQIQHTLNMNFPLQSTTTTSATAIQANHKQQQDKSSFVENQPSKPKHIEKSIKTTSIPRNENETNLFSTLDNNNNNEQTDMAIIDNHQTTSINDYNDNNNNNNNNNAANSNKEDNNDNDEIMTSVNGSRDDDNSNADNGCLKTRDLEDTAQMTLDLVNEFDTNIENNNELQQQQHKKDLVFVESGYSKSTTNNNNNNNNNNSNNDNNSLDQNNNLSLGGQEQQQTQMDQNPCSPVTQIYNKIVDDIETYVLPLEPDQFNSNHHHHSHDYQHNLSLSSSPVQTMDIVNETDEHSHRLNQLTHQEQQLVDRGLKRHNQIQQLNSQLLNNDGVINQEYSSNNNENSSNDIVKDHITCSMDLTGCDLFNDHQRLTNSDDNENVDGNAENLLLNEFKLNSNPENVCENRSGGQMDVCSTMANNNVVESLSNVDDLRDLMMANNCGNVLDHSSLLVDTNSLDLFSFKPIDCHTQIMQQIDVKSSTSDTDALARLSPMLIGSVPRCNSTGNAMQPTHLNSNHHHSHSPQQQHFSSNFLESISSHNSTLPVHHQFVNFQNVSYDNNNNNINENNINSNNSQRSSSTNPSNSTSCSLNSLQSCATKTLSSTNPSICNNNNDLIQNEFTTTTTNSFMKLPLQQRQRSEQQEPCNSILNSLIPKALSLDGGDLIIKNHRNQNQYYQRHRLSASPSNGHGNVKNINQEHLSIPSTIINSQQQQSILPEQQTHINMNIVRNQQSNVTSSVIQNQNTNASIIPSNENHSEILLNINKPSSFQNYSNFNSNQTITESFDYNNNNNNNNNDNNNNSIGSNFNPTNDKEILLPILDYVPNWCNINGGAKVLIIGNWNSLLNNSNYINSSFNKNNNIDSSIIDNNSDYNKDKSNRFFSAMFDHLIVPATLIQDNVLRCYVPSHKEGFITLKVLYMDCVVSEQVLFEMRPSCLNQPSFIQIKGSSSMQQQQQPLQQLNQFCQFSINNHK